MKRSWSNHCVKARARNREIERFEEFTPMLESEEDAVFGYVMGKTLGNFLVIILIRHGRDPTDEEINEMFDILYRRAEEVKRKSG